ncbi:MAG: recombinase family protein [Clostridia bacterium]
MLILNETKWNCASYSRISREDEQGTKSNSIINQKELIREYIKSTPEIRLSLEIEDDGFSGVDFSRPGFKKLMEEVRNGNINCIIVKDLSRLGRNYIEVGRYLDEIFPFLDVRFIAINDDYDSIRSQTSTNEVVVPFKNMMNDAYSGDLSIKIRSQFEIKRKRGDFVGAFAMYGYKKNTENKNQLVPDKYAASVIREMFQWKIEGYSNNGIAKLLNARGEKPPYDYKISNNDNYNMPFKQKAVSQWTSKTVGRILTNPVYIGRLVQGKTTTPNHKIKKVIARPQEEWCIKENAHQPVVNKEIFDIVQNICRKDTRVGKLSDKVHLFAGLAVCGDCGSPMCRKVIPSDGKRYNYLLCVGHKFRQDCSYHYFNEQKLSKIVFKAIKLQINNTLKAEKKLKKMSSNEIKENITKMIIDKLNDNAIEISKTQEHRLRLNESFQDGLINSDDYAKFNDIYLSKLENMEKFNEKLEEDLKQSMETLKTNTSFIDILRQFKQETELTRSLLVCTVREIVIYDTSKIEIEFFYKDKYAELLQLTKSKNEGE